MYLRTKLRRRWTVHVLMYTWATAALWLSGCAGFTSSEPSFREQFAELGSDLRRPANSGAEFGVSKRARQIEQNVGF